jgi:hypothetical protein
MAKAKAPSKDEQIAAARNLYLAHKTDGTHLYSLREIAAELQQKWPGQKVAVDTTIMRWAAKLEWEPLFLRGIEAGSAAAIIEAQPEAQGKTQEEHLQDAIARQRHEDWRMANELKKLAFNHIKKNGFETAKEAISAFTAGANVTKVEKLDVTVHRSHEDWLGET